MLKNISRRKFVSGSAAAALALGLAACGGNGGDAGSEGGDGSSTIEVGIMGPHSGDNAQYGLACLNGAQLYFDQLNADGGINGKQIEAFVYDEKGDATEAVNAYNSLVQNDGVTGIVGDVTTIPTIAVAQASVADNMPCVTPSATAADVVTYGSNYFRACVTDPEQGRVMANFAAEQGYKNVATLYKTGDDYNEGVNAAFCEEAEAQGMTITTQESYSDGDTDFNTQITNILATNPDAILLPNYYNEDGMIVTQARQQGYDKVFLGVDGWSGIYGGSENYADAADLPRLLLLLRLLRLQRLRCHQAVHRGLRGSLQRDAHELLRARLRCRDGSRRRPHRCRGGRPRAGLRGLQAGSDRRHRWWNCRGRHGHHRLRGHR